MDMLPLRCNATGKAGPFFISAYNNFNKSVMHYTEEQKIERVKNALFKAWENLAKFHGDDDTCAHMRQSLYLTNVWILQLLCTDSKNDPDPDIELANMVYDLRSIYAFFETFEASLKT